MSKKDKEEKGEGSDDDLGDDDLEDIFSDIDKDAKTPKPPVAPAGAPPVPSGEGEFSEEAVMEEEEEDKEEPYDPRPLILTLRKQEGNRVEFEIQKQTHGLCNLLRRILLDDERVTLAAYRYDYFNPPRFILELNNIKDFTVILQSATKRIRDYLEGLEKGLASV